MSEFQQNWKIPYQAQASMGKKISLLSLKMHSCMQLHVLTGFGFEYLIIFIADHNNADIIIMVIVFQNRH